MRGICGINQNQKKFNWFVPVSFSLLASIYYIYIYIYIYIINRIYISLYIVIYIFKIILKPARAGLDQCSRKQRDRKVVDLNPRFPKIHTFQFAREGSRRISKEREDYIAERSSRTSRAFDSMQRKERNSLRVRPSIKASAIERGRTCAPRKPCNAAVLLWKGRKAPSLKAASRTVALVLDEERRAAEISVSTSARTGKTTGTKP